jgi:hypothetical protein
MAVLQRAKNLRGTNIFLNKDISEAVQSAREHRNNAYICYDRLSVHPPSQKPGRNERDELQGQ